MDAARDGAFDVLVAEALDRLSRDMEDLAGIHKRLPFLNIEIWQFMKELPTPYLLAFVDWSVSCIEKTTRTKFVGGRLEGWEMV